MESGPLVLGAFVLAFVWLAVMFVRKTQAQKRELYSDRPMAEASAERGDDDAGEDTSGAKAADSTPEPDPQPDDSATEHQGESVPDNKEASADEPSSKAAPADEKLVAGLQRTQAGFLGRINSLLGRKKGLDVALVDELEDILLTADVGVRLSMSLLDQLRSQVKRKDITTAEELRQALKGRLRQALGTRPSADPLALGGTPHVILFVGVNGVGKTTTIGKIAHLYKKERGKNVVLAAGDTFRAAAVQQLEVWGERADCKVIRADEGTDPASVIFNAVQHAVQNEVDVLLADTAGRLHTKTELMDEIRKVKRAAGKACDGAPHEVWLVVDATTGQNAVQQAKEFNEVLGLTGIILTKLDGTAKGGVVIAIADTVGVPVRFVGVGESPEDLRPFDPDTFIDALFSG